MLCLPPVFIPLPHCSLLTVLCYCLSLSLQGCCDCGVWSAPTPRVAGSGVGTCYGHAPAVVCLDFASCTCILCQAFPCWLPLYKALAFHMHGVWHIPKVKSWPVMGVGLRKLHADDFPSRLSQPCMVTLPRSFSTWKIPWHGPVRRDCFRPIAMATVIACMKNLPVESN